MTTTEVPRAPEGNPPSRCDDPAGCTVPIDACYHVGHDDSSRRNGLTGGPRFVVTTDRGVGTSGIGTAIVRGADIVTVMSRTATSGDTLEPLIALPGDWSLWPHALLRGAGFAADLVLGLAAPAATHLVDCLLDAEETEAHTRRDVHDALRAGLHDTPADHHPRIHKALKRLRAARPADPTGVEAMDTQLAALATLRERVEVARAELEAAFPTDNARISAALREVARDPRFREALAWQNRGAIGTALDPLLRAEKRTRIERQHEALVASYLQRYATKNDTVGFFGPTGIARLTADDSVISVRPGARLVSRCGVYFEQWGIDELAAKLSEHPDIRGALAPRRHGFVRLDGTIVHSALSGTHEVTVAEAIVLAACEGTASADELAADLPHRFPDQLAGMRVHDVIAALCAKQLIAWSLVFATVWAPDAELRRRLERLPASTARDDALVALGKLEAAREAISGASGDAASLGKALASLDDTFTQLTERAATRHAGTMYSSRTLVFTDCARDLELRLGARFVADIAPPLRLVLQCGRWLTAQVASAYRPAFAALHADLARRAGSPRVPFSEFWFRSKRMIHGEKGRPFDAVAHELRERWRRILTPSTDPRRLHFTTSELAPKIDEAFAADRAGWRSARYHSPDLLVAASSVEAIQRGDYTVVLGECHFAVNTLRYSCAMAQFPEPRALLDAYANDGAAARVRLVRSKDIGRLGSVRLGNALRVDGDHELEAGLDGSTLPRDRVLRIADLVLEPSGDDLVVRSSDGRFELPLLDLMGPSLEEEIALLREFLPEADHAPRISIDRLVVRRESWTIASSELEFARTESEIDAFVGARRWARTHGMPRFVFVTSPLEPKPLFLDFASPIGARGLAKLARKAMDDAAGVRTLKLVEMLPSLDDVWLPDAEGNRYTGELRLVALDRTGR